MPTAKTYTESLAVRLPTTYAEEIEAALGDVGLSAALRDSALRAIGRADLVLEDDTITARRPTRSSKAQWVVSPVKMTKTQRTALERAAKQQRIATSAMMLNALRDELKLQPREPVARRRGKTKRAAVRTAARRIAPDLELPLDDGYSVPLEIRRRIAAKAGVTVGEATKALQADPDRVGWQLGRRRSSPPTKR